MSFKPIDFNNWERKDMFSYFLSQKMSYSITSNIKITDLYNYTKAQGVKFYPIFIYLVTAVANTSENFRMHITDEGEVGYWETLNPIYTVFDDKTKIYSGVYTPIEGNFKTFYDDYLKDVETYSETGHWLPQFPIPENLLNISMLPWVQFTGININSSNNTNSLLPVITAGKFFQENGETYIPLSIQFHHAVCDGYHASLFINTLQDSIDDFKNILELS